MLVETLEQPVAGRIGRVGDDENLYLVGDASAVDAINAEFYGRFPYPWRPTNFLYPSHGALASAMLGQSLGDWDGTLIPRRPKLWVAGCGTNQAVYTALNFPLATIVGSDLSKPSLELCRSTLRSMGLRNVDLRNESLNAVPYESEFDVVICTGVIHHNSDPQATLQKLARALKPGGVMELMVYNRFHRVMNASVQKAVRLLTGGSLAGGWDAQMGVLNQLIASLPAESAAAEHVAQFHGQPDARVADSLLQPVEYSYTVESLSALAASCGLEIVTYHVSEWDKADDRVCWNMRWTDRDLQARYDALPDLTRWHISNLLMAEQSPMLWFYLQRADSGRPIKSEPQIVGEFLDRRFRRTQSTQRCYILQDNGEYRLSAKQVPYVGMPASGPYRQLLDLCDGRLTMREAFQQSGTTPDFENASRARVFLATSAFPFLTAAA
jgi:SAM-dependent methyltransferase